MFELLVTLGTDKRLFTSVKSKMTNQLATLFELLVTLGTDKRLLTNVNSTMTDQLATLFELLVTLWTDNRLLTTFEKKFFFQKSEINTLKNFEGLRAAPPSQEGVLV